MFLHLQSFGLFYVNMPLRAQVLGTWSYRAAESMAGPVVQSGPICCSHMSAHRALDEPSDLGRVDVLEEVQSPFVSVKFLMITDSCRMLCAARHSRDPPNILEHVLQSASELEMSLAMGV